MAVSIFRLPDLGEGLTEADVVEWYVAEGESVALDQPVVALESAKAVVDIPSPVAGRVRRQPHPAPVRLRCGPLRCPRPAQGPVRSASTSHR